MKYYNLVGDESYDEHGFGYAQAPSAIGFDFLERGKRVNDWQSVIFTLVEGKLADDLANDNGWLMLSSKAKLIFDHAGVEPHYQWLPAIVKDENNDCHDYWILHCVNLLNCIDTEESKYVAGQLVKPVFRARCISNTKVFSYPESESSLIVEEELIKQIKGDELTGFGFMPVKLTE